MGEEHGPGPAQPVVEVDPAGGGVGGEVRHHVAELQAGAGLAGLGEPHLGSAAAGAKFKFSNSI